MENKEKPIIIYSKYKSFGTKIKEEIDEDEDYDDGYSGKKYDVGLEGDYGEADIEREPFVMDESSMPIGVKDYFPHEKTYRFWLAKTNFSITKDIIDIIDNTDGIFSCENFHRYVVRLGVGDLFEPKQVFSSLNKQIFTYLKEQDEIENKFA